MSLLGSKKRGLFVNDPPWVISERPTEYDEQGRPIGQQGGPLAYDPAQDPRQYAPTSMPPQLYGGGVPQNGEALPVQGEQDHTPDYQGHYGMHGRGPDGSVPRKQRNTGEKILRGLGNFALNYAANNGNYGAQLALRERAQRRSARQEGEAKFAEHNRIVSALMRQGMSADQAEMAALNTDKLGEEYNSRFRTRDLAPGHTVATPDFKGNYSRYTAPQLISEGADHMFFDPQNPPTDSRVLPGMFGNGNRPPMLDESGEQSYQLGSRGRSISIPNSDSLQQAPRLQGRHPSQVGLPVPRGGDGRSFGFSLRTEAEQYADTVAQRGTPQWGAAVQDYTLKANGPTAQDFDWRKQTRALDQSDTNNRRTTGTSRENNIRTNQTSRDNSVRSAQTTRGSHTYKTGPARGGGGRLARAKDAQGNVVELRNGQWVPVAR